MENEDSFYNISEGSIDSDTLFSQALDLAETNYAYHPMPEDSINPAAEESHV